MMLENMYVDPAKGNFFYTALKPTFNEQGQIQRGNATQSIRISKNFEVKINITKFKLLEFHYKHGIGRTICLLLRFFKLGFQ